MSGALDMGGSRQRAGRVILSRRRGDRMERQVWICTECSKAILPEDTFILHSDWLSHLDCQRPCALSPEERVVLFHYCRDHAVAECE
jgi:hypothetical protein